MENNDLRTGIVYGYFDVRDFDTKEIKQQGEPISVRVIWDADKLPQELAQAAQQFQGKDGALKAGVKFRIKKCHWYNKDAQRVVMPDYVELDDVRFRLDIVYRLNEYQGATYAWVNHIQFMQVLNADNPFQPMADTDAPSENPKGYAELAKEIQTTAPANGEDDLPF